MDDIDRLRISSIRAAKGAQRELLGKPLDFVFAKAQASGLVLRVSSIDNVPRVLTRDYHVNRINVDVIDGIVKNIWLG